MKRYRKAKDIRAGVVGYGPAYEMGAYHLNLARKAGITPTAVVDLDPARRKAAEKDFPGIETYASVSAMLKKSNTNLVILITPHNTHARLALQCLKAGRHIVSEKPLAITTAECDRMIREARRQKLVLTTFHNRHWDGCILEALKHIRERRAIGDVYRIEAHMGGCSRPRDWWRDSKSISGGILYDWGVHLLEYSLQLIDDDMMEVTGYSKTGYWVPKSPWKQDANEDEAFAVVRFKRGAWLTLGVSHLDANPKRGMLEITGTEGSYIMDGTTYEMIQRRGDRTVITRGDNTETRWEAYYKDVASHLVKGTKLVITPEWARRPIHILDLANRSAGLGRAIRTTYA